VKILRTLEGGLRVDAEDAEDWILLIGITHDAVSCDMNLAGRLGGLITGEELAEDWREFIIPDLEETFQTDLACVAAAISAAQLEAAGGAGHLWITRDEAMTWYSALNQARLAIEEIHHFGPGERIRPETLPPETQAAFLRSQFYCALQTLLLDQVMR
jgi:hypothetical protein